MRNKVVTPLVLHGALLTAFLTAGGKTHHGPHGQQASLTGKQQAVSCGQPKVQRHHAGHLHHHSWTRTAGHPV